MTLLQKFSIACLAALCIFGVSLGFIITRSLEHFMIKEAEKTTAEIVAKEASRQFKQEDFASVKNGADYDEFTARVKNLNFGKNVERIKIWGIDGTVLWADSREIVGLNFIADNKDLQKAVSGKVVSEISSLSKLENITERYHGRLLELYVPVSFQNVTGISSVFEIYMNIRELSIAIEAEKRLIWKTITVGFSFLYIALFGIVRGASRRIERHHEEIARSEAKYHNLVRSAHDGILSVDEKGRIMLFNDAVERMFGRSFSNVRETSAFDLFVQEDHERFRTVLTDCIKCRGGECDDPLEIRGLRIDNTAFPVEITPSASEKENGLMVTCFLRDITERKFMQAQLIQSEKMAGISVIAGSIGHEINNILSSLLGYSELLLYRKGNDEFTTQCAEVFGSQTQRLKLHAKNLLSLGKPQTPEMKEIALHGFLDNVTEMLDVSGMFKLCTLIKKYASEEIVIVGDEMLLEQVVRNLQINALHAMEKQGILTMATKVSDDGKFAEISFSDTGHGIKDNIRHQIFLPFFTTKEKGKGTGLGLYIVKQIIDQHQGYIKLESEDGRGTTVLIGIPLRTE